ncbi:MAG: hypothetical protein KF760_35200 [Candidatus Eremiobacteraeota bacterium]|nr:hypothetical protein [Candidatus Eremiobacteraeota bacterium]MCW5870209.1 hypothetical protein [Candidatus Eremiobacteraeota bacterium]
MKASSVLFAGLLACMSIQTGADEVSGPFRMTLADEAWGTIYYVPSQLVTYRYTRNSETGEREMSSKHGKVKIFEAGIGAYDVVGPKHSLKVEGSSSEVKVTFDNKVYTFSHSPAGLKITTPKDSYHYANKGEDISAVGPFGRTLIRNQNGHYHVTSPKGEYSYTPLEGGGFEVKGGPLMSHPGLYRGASFTIDGVGVFIDFRKMDPDNALFRFLEFQPQLEYK